MKNYNRVGFAVGGIAKITKEAARSKGARKAK